MYAAAGVSVALLAALRARSLSRRTPASVRASAPGKVLLTGGYLVLERPSAGLVLSTTAKFHTTVSWHAGVVSTDAASQRVTVHSPQFAQHLQLDMRRDPETGVWRCESGGGSNAYVEGTIALTLTAIDGLKGPSQSNRRPLQVLLEADNDFYSQLQHLKARGWSISRETLSSLPQYLPCPTDPDTGKPIVAKTGMGSSAALITSLVAGLLQLLAPEEAGDRDLVHNLAQACHMLAQGKVGSGFDVSAAVYGSHRYTRFSPEVLLELPSEPTPADIAACLRATDRWDQCREPFALPEGLVLMMGDVNGGSETPGMVRKVLAWHAGEDTQSIWTSLDAANGEVERLLRAGAPDNEVSAAYLRVRELLRAMGAAAGVPIEPTRQTVLANQTMDMPGVLMSGVPGAGGDDAIFAVVRGQEAAQQVADMWISRGNVCPLLLEEGGTEGLSVVASH